MANRTLQSRLKDLRAEGLSYAELGRQLGVDRSTVSRWASGKRNPSAKVRRRIYERWRRRDKRLRNPGAVVDLSGYFRRVWYDERPILPIAYRKVPPYGFPASAAVVATARYAMTFIDVGGLEESEGSFNITIGPNEDIGRAVQDRFLEFVEKAQTSFRRLLKVRREVVILRWLKV